MKYKLIFKIILMKVLTLLIHLILSNLIFLSFGRLNQLFILEFILSLVMVIQGHCILFHNIHHQFLQIILKRILHKDNFVNVFQ